MSAFETKVKSLAYHSGLRVAQTDSSRAKLAFTFSRDGRETTQHVWITPFARGEYWEFSCQTAIKEKDPQEIPKWLLVLVLQLNAHQHHGFWCIEEFERSGNNVLEYMHDVPSTLITPEEFELNCRTAAREVDKLERTLSGR